MLGFFHNRVATLVTTAFRDTNQCVSVYSTSIQNISYKSMNHFGILFKSYISFF